eukprot:jgi/Tetstr1/453276/TSEL_003958.t1
MLAASTASKKGSSSDGGIMRLRKPVCRTAHTTIKEIKCGWLPSPPAGRADPLATAALPAGIALPAALPCYWLPAWTRLPPQLSPPASRCMRRCPAAEGCPRDPHASAALPLAPPWRTISTFLATRLVICFVMLLTEKDGMSWALKLAPLLSKAKIATSGFTDAILLPAQNTLDNLREVAQSKERELALGKMAIHFAVEYFSPGCSSGSNIHSYLNILKGFRGFRMLSLAPLDIGKSKRYAYCEHI